MKIEIVTTPNETLKETGFGTIKACNSVLHSIEKMGYTARLNICKTKQDLDDIVRRKPSLIVLAVKYLPLRNQDDLWLADFFTHHKINFTGSSMDGLKFDSNKILAKSHLRNKGIATANYFTATPGQYKSENELPISFPLFLKPMDAANGNGIDELSFVKCFSEFEVKLLSLYQLFKAPVLVEEYLDGQEFTVAVIRTSNNNLIAAPIEIIPPKSENGIRILGEEVKRNDSEELRRIWDGETRAKVKNLAISVFVNLGIRDFARVDIKANKNGDYFFLEANLLPGMTFGSSYFPKAFEIERNLNYDEVIELVLNSGLSRVSNVNPSPNLQMFSAEFNGSCKSAGGSSIMA